MPANAAFLMEIALFKDFSSEELKHMAETLEDVELEPDQVLFKEGAWAASLYLVCTGAIEIYKAVGEGKEVTLTTLTEGACLGEMALVRDMYRTGSARAKVASKLLVLKKERLEKMGTATPHVAMRLYKNISAILADRIDTLNRDLARARTEPAEKKSGGVFGRLFGG